MAVSLVISVPHGEVEIASDVVWSLGVVAIEERDVGSGVELWTSVGDDPDSIDAAVEELGSRWTWRVEHVDDAVVDTWRTSARPIPVADDFVVRPAWVPLDAPAGTTVLTIEPGSTFGLGDHPTTVSTLRAMRRVLRFGDSVLDVGTGSGVLAIAAAVLGASRVDAIDVSPASPPTATANARANGVADRVAASMLPLSQVEDSYDVVVANILAPTLVELSADLVRVTRGVLVISGILADRHSHVLDALVPLRPVELDVLDGWAAVTLRR